MCYLSIGDDSGSSNGWYFALSGGMALVLQRRQGEALPRHRHVVANRNRRHPHLASPRRHGAEAWFRDAAVLRDRAADRRRHGRADRGAPPMPVRKVHGGIPLADSRRHRLSLLHPARYRLDREQQHDHRAVTPTSPSSRQSCDARPTPSRRGRLLDARAFESCYKDETQEL